MAGNDLLLCLYGYNNTMNLQTLRTSYRDGILQLAAKHKLEDIRVFGSVVRGQQHLGSDIDFWCIRKKVVHY